ncbi:MAG: T9SS type A sorting domain-containing protein [Taibaiella sp.]|nr:T9SS type A sorting domain-containing protein [Taibaiella sp.]
MKLIFILLLTTSFLLGGPLAANAQITAHFTGTEESGFTSGYWTDSANWSYFNVETGESIDYSGLPDSTMNLELYDVIVAVPEGWEVSCKSIMGTSFSISLEGNATISIFGNVESGGLGMGGNIRGEASSNDRILFCGDTDQYVSYSRLRADKVEVSKPAGNVYAYVRSNMLVYDSLIFSNAPVPLGEAPSGNIIVIGGGNIILDYDAYIDLPAFTEEEVPPHIVMKKPISMTSYFYRNFFFYANLSDFYHPDFTEPLYYPVGASEYSFTPVTITPEAIGTTHFTIQPATDSFFACDEFIFAEDSAVNVSWKVTPFSLDTTDGLPIIYDHSLEPVDIELSFNKQNIGYDVSGTFHPTDLALFDSDSAGCYFYTDILSDTSEHYVKVARQHQVHFGNFTVGKSPDIEVMTGIEVVVEGGAEPVIHSVGGSLSLEAHILPETAYEAITWSIVPITGNASIDSEGEVTGISEGTVYAKASYTYNPEISDSVLLTIVDTTLGLQVPAVMNGLEVYPNPFKDQLTVKLPSSQEILKIEVFDMLGKRIYEPGLMDKAYTAAFDLKIPQLSKGVYVLCIYTHASVYFKKIIKE